MGKFIKTQALRLDGNTTYYTDEFQLNVTDELYIAIVLSVDDFVLNRTQDIVGWYENNDYVWKLVATSGHTGIGAFLFNVKTNTSEESATFSLSSTLFSSKPILLELYMKNNVLYIAAVSMLVSTHNLSEPMKSISNGRIKIAAPTDYIFKGVIDYIAIANHVPDDMINEKLRLYWGNHIPVGYQDMTIDNLIHYYSFEGHLGDLVGGKTLYGTSSPTFVDGYCVTSNYTLMRQHGKFKPIFRTHLPY